MPNMPIYSQQTTPSGSMMAQASGVRVQDPWGPAIQDLGQGVASLGQSLGNIQKFQITEANRLQQDKDEIWAASTAADIDVKMTKRMADLSVDPGIQSLTPVIEKEIDTMVEEHSQDATDQQKKLLSHRSVGLRRELITAAIGRDAARGVAEVEANLEKHGQSVAAKVAYNDKNGAWSPDLKAIEARNASQEVAAELAKANVLPQQKLAIQAKVDAGIVDAYMGRLIDVDPDTAMDALSGKLPDGPITEMVKKVPAAALDSYRNRAQSVAIVQLNERSRQSVELQKAYSDAANKQVGALFYSDQLTPDALENLGKHLSADDLNGWRAKLYTQTVVPMQKAQKDRVEAVVLQNTRNTIETLKNQGRHDQIEPLIQSTDLSPERKKELSADSANPSRLQATVAKATEEMTKDEKGKLNPQFKAGWENTSDYRDLSLAAELTINKYRNAGIVPETEVQDTLKRAYYNLKTDKDATLFSFPRPGSGAKIEFNFPAMSKERANTLLLQAFKDLDTVKSSQGEDSEEFHSRVIKLRHITRMYRAFYMNVPPNSGTKPTSPQPAKPR